MHKKNQGYTLVELLVGITVGALVTLAATTVILMGLRLNRQSMDTTGKQNTARVLLTSLENLATDGSVSGFSMDIDGWQIYGKDGSAGVIYSYDTETQTVYTGGTTITDDQVISTNETPIMQGVLSSYLSYDDGLLTISLETEEDVFVSSVYCRVLNGSSGSNKNEDNADDTAGKVEEEAEEDFPQNTPELMSEKEKAARLVFVNVLMSQYSSGEKNTGYILEDGVNTGNFYSQWYITSNFTKNENWQNNGWDEFTPWCACYVSWAISEVGAALTPDVNSDGGTYLPSYAGVDSFLSYFYLKDDPDTANKRDYWITAEDWKTADTIAAEGGEKTVYPGDVIFLDWTVDDIRNPQHVGVVLYVEGGYVYTIEGNVAASYTDGGRYGTVGLRKYAVDDPRILGYGVLDWKTE